ncbi:hypothetical protein RJ639_013997 [Escallonia herrerae]|uniref:Integrase catalytic domain-containing protein n=1 Tax=Escallonia herrerae TaxID=1293975 RepID=A0AA89AMV3_9ASTE|nr:hypothetical protein RJ639_013997 [Escallonia herrerae]
MAKDAETSKPKHLDPTSEYYLSSQANSGNSLTKDTLKGDNYVAWEQSAILTLKSHNKLAFIDGRITKPDPESEDFLAWDIVNSMLCSWICNSLDPPIRATVSRLNEAKLIWDSLKTRYSIPNRPRIYKLWSDASMTTQGGAFVITYYTKLLGMWDELLTLSPLESCGCPKGTEKMNWYQDLQTYQFLMGLDDKYATLRTQIINMDPFPNIDRVYAMVMQEESHQGITGSRDTTSAVGFHAQNGPPTAQSSGLVSATAGDPDRTPTGRPWCTFCHRVGHIGEMLSPPWYCSAWLLDGLQTNAIKASSVSLADDITLRHVVYMPNLAVNLISVSCLAADANCFVAFSNDICVLQDRTSKSPIGLGKMHRRVFVFQPLSTAIVASVSESESESESYELWHRRMGHPSSQPLIHLPTVSVVSPSLKTIYDVRCRAKHNRTVFPDSTSRAMDIFGLVHCDIWGPYRVSTISGTKYFLTIVDDYSRAVRVYLMHDKGQTGTLLRNFCNMVHNQFGKLVKIIRSDNGHEFDSQPMTQFCNDHASPPSSPTAPSPTLGRGKRQKKVPSVLKDYSSRNWFAKLSTALRSYGFLQSHADHTLFTYRKGDVFLSVLVYVDDLILAGNNSTTCSSFKKYLNDCFKLKDLGPLKYFLGIEATRGPRGLFLSQCKYALDILSESGLSASKPAAFPMEQNHGLALAGGPLLSDPRPYRRLIGRLVYLTITRTDICYAVHVLSQFMQSPRSQHWDAALWVLWYLKAAPGQGLFLLADSPLQIYAFCDSDWASCPLTRRSVTGYFVSLGNSPISWRTKKQPTVSRSSPEAEYRSMAVTTCELTWLKSFLLSLGVHHDRPMRLFCDNQAAYYFEPGLS